MKKPDNCQLTSVEKLSEGLDNPLWFLSLRRLFRTFSTRLSPRFKRRVKKFLQIPFGTLTKPAPQIKEEIPVPRKEVIPVPPKDELSVPPEKKSMVLDSGLQSGDIVRVKSLQEIQATLDMSGQLRGCSFMPEMSQYCETEQRVYRSVRRFVDERDRLVKKSRGLVLLEGIHCQGTQEFGPCDRSCFYFWREDWLEKVERPEQ